MYFRMNKLLFVLFVSEVTLFCAACHSSLKSISRNPIINDIPFAQTPSSQLNFSAGDIISCNVNILVSHIFLASCDSYVIYVEGDTEEIPFKTRIAEKHFDQVASAYKFCEVITEVYDEKYAKLCKGVPLETAEIIRKARSSLHTFIRRYTKFSSLKCNSEHWVSAWRYGTAWTLQTGPEVFVNKFRGDDCEAPGLQECYQRTNLKSTLSI